MCQAFSALVTKSKKVYWQAGIDSHDGLVEKFKKKDKELKDDKLPPKNTFARIEVPPANKDYLNPDRWVYQIDEKVKPEWLDKTYKPFCMVAFRKWKKQIYTFDIKEARNPINPLKIKPPKITQKHIDLLRAWASVRDSVWSSVWASVGDSVGSSVGDSVWSSVRASVWSSVWASVGDSVGDSVWSSVWASVGDSVGASVWASVGDSVGDSVWSYIGSLFLLKEWKYVDYKKLKIRKGVYPFKPAVDLWKQGLVPSFDGTTWRLHGGRKAKILWEGKI